ncbi:CHAP domain-containing protein [Puniceibacterium sediminis]|uniref:CHAP domain-containing protein n=1 Tax=Puniceibacterium sediminis TaxID=1608407 RepID=A0A238XNR9_9RHOB|nr:CHAP domain-containing protein [Puniceibacterium sediminis]SNR60625.1 CHAP domain-containing protein [Puniceibacterium sediminis]
MSVKNATPSLRKLSSLCVLLLLCAACSGTAPTVSTQSSRVSLDPARQAMAISEAKALRAKGQRVWCVPFARNVSGVEIRGNAETWWAKARGLYDRGDEPAVGAVMAFKPTGGMPMGHVAVVSQVVSPREVLVDHANWSRNEVSLKMPVIDVSERNDWSAVRLASQPSAFGSVYPVNGFIYPASKS